MPPDLLPHPVRTRFPAPRAPGGLLCVGLLLVLMVSPLHGAFAQATAVAPWRALYRGAIGSEIVGSEIVGSGGVGSGGVGSEIVWIDVTLTTIPGDSSAGAGTSMPPRYNLEARVLLPDRQAVLFGEGRGSDDGGLHMLLRDDTGGRGVPGSRGAPGTVVGSLDALRSIAANDDGRTLEGSIDLSGNSRTLAAHRVAQYAYLSYQLGPVIASMGLPDFHGGPWQAIDEPLWQAEVDDLRAFTSEGRADYIDRMVWHGWTSESDTTVQGLSSDHLSLLSARYRYTGGAHGNTTYVARTYEATATGLQPIDLAALLSTEPAARSELVAYVLDELRSQDATWVAQGEVDTLSDDDLSLFSLTPQGLQFVFPPYAMG